MSEHINSSTKGKAPLSGVVVGDNKYRHHKSPVPPASKKSRVTVFVVVAVLIITAAALTVYHSSKNSSSSTQPKTVAKIVEPKLTNEQQAQKQAGAGNYTAAEQAYDDELKTTSDKPTQANIYWEQVTTALQFNKYDDAKAYAAKIQAIQPNSTIYYVAQADIAVAQGDNASARTYWQDVINSLDKKSPQYPTLLKQYQADLQAAS